MNYSLLGSSQLNISQISLGCMSLPLNEGESIPLLHKAIEYGINFFDTADIYQNGENEKLLGKAFKGKRDKILIASKAGNVVRADGSGLDWNPSKKHILSCIEGTLKRLQTDYVDLYQLHGGTINDNIDESIEAFELLLQQGKILHFGISSIRPNVIREYIKRSSIISVMTQYSLLDRRPEEENLDLLHKNNIGVLVRGAVAQGLLINKPAKPYLDHSTEVVEKAASAVRELSSGNRTATHTAIRYVLQHPAVTSAVIGVRTIEQLEDVVNTFSSDPLTQTELDFLSNAIPANYYKDHR